MDDRGAERLGRGLANVVVIASFLFMIWSIARAKGLL
jgi:hypothetical protein